MPGQTLGPPLAGLRDLTLVDTLQQYGGVLALLAAAAVVLLGRGAVVLWRPGEAEANHVHLGRILATAALIAGGFGFLHAVTTGFNWLPRHAFYLLPFVALLLPLGLADVPGKGGRAGVAHVSLVVLLGLNIHSVWNHYFAPEHQRDDYRGVAELLAYDATWPEVSVLLDGDIGLLRYYGDKQTVAARDLVRAVDFVADLHELTGSADEVALVLNRGHVFRARFQRMHGRPFEDVLADCCALRETTRLAMFEIYRVSLAEMEGGRPALTPA